MEILFASANRHKFREVRRIMADCGIQVVGLADAGDLAAVKQAPPRARLNRTPLVGTPKRRLSDLSALLVAAGLPLPLCHHAKPTPSNVLLVSLVFANAS